MPPLSPRRQALLALVLSLATLSFQGCGRKGALVLPPPDPAAPPPVVTPAPPPR